MVFKILSAKIEADSTTNNFFAVMEKIHSHKRSIYMEFTRKIAERNFRSIRLFRTRPNSRFLSSHKIHLVRRLMCETITAPRHCFRKTLIRQEQHGGFEIPYEIGNKTNNHDILLYSPLRGVTTTSERPIWNVGN